MGSLALVRDVLVRPQRRERYGDHRWAVGDLYLPRGPGPFPVAVLIHGGYWRAKYGKRLMRAQAGDLRRRGYAVWNIEFRRLGQGGGWPATFDDVGAAIDQLEKLDAPLDLNDVAAIGHSAGGQLALWAATRPALPEGAPGAAPRVRLTRVVGQGPVTDLRKTYAVSGPAGGAVGELLGGSPEEVPDRYACTDPVQRLPVRVGMLLVHGTADETIPIKRTRVYAELAREAADAVSFVEIPDGGHRGHLDTRTPDWAAVVGWLEGEAGRARAGTSAREEQHA